MRGHWVELTSAWQELRGLRNRAPALDALLGEAVAASVLLAATLKFAGRLTLQFSGNGAVRLLVAQCTHDFRVRAVVEARPATSDLDRELPLPDDFAALVGDGRLLVTIDDGARGGRYQGIVPLDGASLAGCVETYFASSEQLPTRLRLHADAGRCGGLLLQRLPASGQDEGESEAAGRAWRDVQSGLAALPASAPSSEPIEVWLPRLCAPHDVRLFGAKPVRFECNCSMQRVGELLRSLGEAEARAILAEQGAVSVTCEFCGRPYRFASADIERLFGANQLPEADRGLN